MIAKKKILVVEDNKINRTMLSSILSTEYQVLEAENGLEALSVLEKHSEELSLILLDIVMPIMDGYTFLSSVKANSSYSSIPVIVTTHNDGESDEVAALSLGAADFVAKPYRPQIILHRVASIINLRETAAMINQFQFDRLTKLYSKEFFYQRAQSIIVQNPELQYDIICSDIENFKLINDVFGIPAGDQLLQGIADIYKNTIGHFGICGRLNADQFVCLIERRHTYTDQYFIARNKQVNALSPEKNVVMKWGIYSINNKSESIEQMCDRALLAARSIKGQYGKYFAYYDHTLRDKLLREQAITDGMEEALSENQFEVYFQPKYNLENNSLAGVEALVRWNHPEWGIQSPAWFIPLFEKNGFITKLDQYVWDRTCAILKEWDNKGYPCFPASVNVSRADIYNANIPDILIDTVKKYNLTPSRLHLEITESAYTENPDQIIGAVSRLRDLGFIIEMDDFGSGYSSLNMLNQMPLDILKLDMKFVQSETAKPVSQGILRFIMNLARWMDLSVVAEGVETQEQLTRLREIGCDYAQGYFFQKPMPSRELEELIKKQNRETDSHRGVNKDAYEKKFTKVILIADEDEKYCDKVREAFEDSYQIAQALDIDSALSLIAAYEDKLAAIILSLTIAGKEHPDVLETILRDKSIINIPIVTTGTLDEKLEEQALLSGAADFAGKPHLPSSLRRRVQRAIDEYKYKKREYISHDKSYRDYLTGLLNRRGFEYAFDSLCDDDGPFAMCLFTLNNQDEICHKFGKTAWDHLIMSFGALLRTHTRGADILARNGENEFIAIFRKMSGSDKTLKRGEDIRKAFCDICKAQNIDNTVSVGIAVWNTAEAAQSVLYRAKENSKTAT